MESGNIQDSWIRVTDISSNSVADIDTDVEYLHALTFGDTDSDSDGDGIFDSEDFCPETRLGVYVDYEGCSGEQNVDMECPCKSDWKNHGEYMKCVVFSAKGQLEDGLILLEEKDTIVSHRARGAGGKKKYAGIQKAGMLCFFWAASEMALPFLLYFMLLFTVLYNLFNQT